MHGNRLHQQLPFVVYASKERRHRGHITALPSIVAVVCYAAQAGVGGVRGALIDLAVDEVVVADARKGRQAPEPVQVAAEVVADHPLTGVEGVELLLGAGLNEVLRVGREQVPEVLDSIGQRGEVRGANLQIIENCCVAISYEAMYVAMELRKGPRDPCWFQKIDEFDPFIRKGRTKGGGRCTSCEK